MYKKPETAEDLAGAIAELELIAAAQKREIQETFLIVSENLKPSNLVKSGVRSVLSGSHNDELVNILIGLGTGFIGRNLILGKPHGFVGKTVGKAIQWGMAGLVSKNAEAIKEKPAISLTGFSGRPKKTPHGSIPNKIYSFLTEVLNVFSSLCMETGDGTFHFSRPVVQVVIIEYRAQFQRRRKVQQHVTFIR